MGFLLGLIYQIRNHPSQQLKAVLDYLVNVESWDFWRAQQAIHIWFYPTDLARVLALVTPHQQWIYWMSSYLAGLTEWRNPRGVFPPGLCFHPRFGRADCKQRRYIKSTRVRVKLASEYVLYLALSLSPRARPIYHAYITPSRIHADIRKIGQSRGHFQFHVWNWQRTRTSSSISPSLSTINVRW